MRNDSFNAAQLKAITHYKGPAMVLAGPGSGKTRVIVERLRHLIEERKVPPSSILVITFTKAAAIEMQYRFMKITDSSYPEVSFGTFHSIFYQIIKRSIKGKSVPEIATEGFKYEVIRDILVALKTQGKISNDTLEDSFDEIPDIISEISRIKNMDISPLSSKTGLAVKHCFYDVFNSYGKALSDFGKIDFDDMIERCYRILKDDKDLLSDWQKRFEFILIDEYQDINPMQHKVISLLSEGHNNLFVVGDDDQSIYGFRGSDPNIMLSFKDYYSDRGEDISLINLDINYRCGKEILQNAIMVIDANTIRFHKNLKANAQNGMGKVLARRYESRAKQSEAIVFFLRKHMEDLSRIAFLFRTNSEALMLARVLKENDIPSNLESQSKSIFEDRAVMLCVSYLFFAFKGNKRSYFLKIMNQPMRYISRESIASETVMEKEVLSFYRGNASRQKKIRSLFNSIKMISHLRPALSVRYLRKNVGIDELFPESATALDEFEKKSREYEYMKNFLEYIDENISKPEGKNKEKRNENNSGNRVKLMTMHGCKGLEFDIVWIPDLNEGIIPSRSAVEIMQIEEERRMLYVAMTRAKQALIMSYITGNKENPMLPTRFLKPVKQLWDKNYSSSSSSSGISTSSSNSASSR